MNTTEKSKAIILFLFCLFQALAGKAEIRSRAQDDDFIEIQNSIHQWLQIPEQRTNEFSDPGIILFAARPDLFLDQLQAGADQGNPLYQALLGWSYRYGWGVLVDTNKAKQWLCKSAAQGDPRGEVGLGELLIADHREKTNQTEALRLFKDAASKKLPVAQFYVGLCHHFGYGTATNLDEARRFYELSDQQGFAPATCNLAGLYDNAQGVPLDHFKAFELNRRAALQNFPSALHGLGVSYARGEGVAQDYSAAARWYRAAALLGYAPAQHNLGTALMNGRGVTPDLQEAEYWLHRAANAGIAEALTTHAMLILSGKVPGSIPSAVEELEVAAKDGNPLGQAILGGMYSQLVPKVSQWVKTDYDKAAQLLRPAAETGNPIAEYYLGIMCAEGRGVSKDAVEAFKWFVLAEKQGYSERVEGHATMASVREDLTASQLVEGLRRARAFRPVLAPDDPQGTKFSPSRR